MTEKPSRIRQAITGLAELHGKTLSNLAAELFEKALKDYPEHDILLALTRCLKDLSHFPTPAEVIARVDDGHPGPEEAWALVPKNEADSAVWTQEMREAFFAGASSLIDDDPIAARMAFKETYAKLLTQSRMKRKKAKWELSLGHDQRGRQAAAILAVDRGYLPSSEVAHLIEDRNTPTLLLDMASRALEDKREPQPHVKADARESLETFVKELREKQSQPAQATEQQQESSATDDSTERTDDNSSV